MDCANVNWARQHKKRKVQRIIANEIRDGSLGVIKILSDLNSCNLKTVKCYSFGIAIFRVIFCKSRDKE